MQDGMTILVTGGQGFIGSHLVNSLRRDGHQVILLDRRWQKRWDGDFQLGDVRDRDSVFDAMSRSSAWINLAGLLGTAEMVENPGPAVETNILGALNVFEAARMYEKPGVQIAVGNHWMNNPYSITKSTAERFALMYNKEHGTDIQVIRAMNVFGEGQKHRPIRKLFPNLVIPALLNRPLTVYGDGSQIMDLIYVGDVVEVLKKAAIRGGRDVYNVGMGGDLTVNRIVDLILQFTESDSEVHRVPMRPGEEEQAVVQATAEDIAKVKVDFDLTFTPLDEGIDRVVRWYRQNLEEFSWDE